MHLLLSLLLAADPAPMSGGAQPEPSETTEVAIARERLTIDIDFDHADVAAELELENPGGKTKLRVGFPCDEERAETITSLVCSDAIEVRVRGKPVRTAHKPGHHVWTMTFGAGEKVPLAVKYRAPLWNPRYRVPILGMGAFFYRLKTGARWAGPIGALELTVRTPIDALAYIAPGGYTRKPGEITWSLTNYEPTADLELLVASMAASGEIHACTGKTARKAAEIRARGECDGTLLREAAGALESPAGRRFAALFHRQIGLPDPPDDQVTRTIEESARLLRESAGTR